MNNDRLFSLKILGDIDRKEACDIAQKAKIKWAIEGDENTSFFHGTFKKKRRQSAIKGILNNGVWIDEPGEVKSEFFSHFRNSFSCSGSSRLSIGDVPLNQISVKHRTRKLNKPFGIVVVIVLRVRMVLRLNSLKLFGMSSKMMW